MRERGGWTEGRCHIVHVLVFELELVFLAGGRAFLLLVCVLVWCVCVSIRIKFDWQKWDGNEGGRGGGREKERGRRGTGETETRLTHSALYARLSAARARDC